ncbi:MAG: xanthine dehydrogenase family protein subunit M [Acidobacteria bacterium]|nr:xanthine dehydrogenase family protein subunit M [Acidobacteriota bacterium]
MNPFEYASADSLDDAVALLREKKGRVRVIAGGTDLIPQMKSGVAEPERLVDLKGIPGLDRVEISAGGLRLGTLVPLTEIASHPGIRESHAALAQGASAAASPQIRNAGTLGGNLCQRPRCWYFRNEDFHCRKKGGSECFALEGENKYHAIFGGDDCCIVHPSDTAPALVACEAEATLRSPRGERRVPLADFFVLPSVDVRWENILAKDEILVSVFAPSPPPGTRASYTKIRERASFDFALASVAAVLTFEGATCTRARIVLGGVAPIPWPCPAAESVLVGHALDDALIAHASNAALEGAAPLSKNRYKVSLTRGIIRRALANLNASKEGT